MLAAWLKASGHPMPDAQETAALDAETAIVIIVVLHQRSTRVEDTPVDAIENV